eukprot:Pgem_evm1s10877
MFPVNESSNNNNEIERLLQISKRGKIKRQKSEIVTDVGTPLPDEQHAVSVSMPMWQNNVDYEE